MTDNADELFQRLKRPGPWDHDPNALPQMRSGGRDVFGGQAVPINFGGPGIFDSNNSMTQLIWIPAIVYVVHDCKVLLDFREYPADATAATSSGDLTSNSGGGSTSGASSAASSASGGSSTPTSSTAVDHRHRMFAHLSDTAGGTTRAFGVKTAADGSTSTTAHINTVGTGDLYTQDASGAHSHTVTIAGHTHDISHTHTTPNHQHTTPGHTHALTYGVFKETYPASHNVTLTLSERVAGVWTVLGTVTGLTDDIEEVSLAEWVDGPGQYRITLQSAAAQPQGGRLGCDIGGYAIGAIQVA